MRKIIAFETPDNQRFFNEAEARTHERRYDFGNQIDSAVRSDPQFARLDRGLLIDYFMKHGSTIGKLADSPITPQEIRGIPAGFSGTLEEKTKRPTTGILPHPSSPEGQRRVGKAPELGMGYGSDLASRRAEGMEPNSVKVSHREPSLEDDMVAELDRALANPEA